jgi:hypothetical protein
VVGYKKRYAIGRKRLIEEQNAGGGGVGYIKDSEGYSVVIQNTLPYFWGKLNFLYNVRQLQEFYSDDC